MLNKLIAAMLCVMIVVGSLGTCQSSAKSIKADSISAGQKTDDDSAEKKTDKDSAGQKTDVDTEKPDGGASEQSVADLKAGISKIEKYGNLVLTIGADSMEELGYEVADIIKVRIGDAEIEMPIGEKSTDADSGEPLCWYKVDPPEPRKVLLILNSGNLAEYMGIAKKIPVDEDPGYKWQYSDGFDASVDVSISMVEKQGYADEYRMHQIGGTRSNDRSDYKDLSDEEFANFRAVSTTGMGDYALFRSSSPVKPTLGRNEYADQALLDYGVRTIMNMADSDAEMRRYADYSLTSYSRCDIIALSMSMDFFAEDFRQKIAQGFRFFASHEGPYLIHCNEGKDRTGYAIAILECLMGADAGEVIEDYMLTYRNFYGIEPGSDQYKEVSDNNIEANLEKTFGISSIDDKDVDLQACAEAYLRDIGMNEEEILALKKNLSTSYPIE